MKRKKRKRKIRRNQKNQARNRKFLTLILLKMKENTFLQNHQKVKCTNLIQSLTNLIKKLKKLKALI